MWTWLKFPGLTSWSRLLTEVWVRILMEATCLQHLLEYYLKRTLYCWATPLCASSGGWSYSTISMSWRWLGVTVWKSFSSIFCYLSFFLTENIFELITLTYHDIETYKSMRNYKSSVYQLSIKSYGYLLPRCRGSYLKRKDQQ